VPGISWVLGYTIAAEIGDIGRFASPKRFTGYTGLCPRVYRTWRLYMAAARRGFEQGSLDVVQLLLARSADDRPADVPLRPWW
jgi:transposase